MRILHDVRRCVVFFGKASPPSGEIVYGGTGFLAIDEEGDPVPYLITCRHVAQQLESDFVIRVNKKGGESVPLPINNIKWSYHPDPTVDLAATAFYLVDSNTYDVILLNLKHLQFFDPNDMACGDPISIIGLFRLHIGTKRNVPIVHTGNIAILPDPNEKIPLANRATGERMEVEGYLVEAQTLEGLSGSPVFVQKFVNLRGGNVVAQAYGDGRLLGLYQGAWDGRPGEVLAADRNLTTGNFRVPVGMGIVVPAERISELIKNDPEFKVNREKLRQLRLSRTAATMDAALSPSNATDSDASADGANPRHLEDFKRLVDVAARKRPQGDQT